MAIQYGWDKKLSVAIQNTSITWTSQQIALLLIFYKVTSSLVTLLAFTYDSKQFADILVHTVGFKSTHFVFQILAFSVYDMSTSLPSYSVQITSIILAFSKVIYSFGTLIWYRSWTSKSFSYFQSNSSISHLMRCSICSLHLFLTTW